MKGIAATLGIRERLRQRLLRGREPVPNVSERRSRKE